MPHSGWGLREPVALSAPPLPEPEMYRGAGEQGLLQKRGVRGAVARRAWGPTCLWLWLQQEGGQRGSCTDCSRDCTQSAPLSFMLLCEMLKDPGSLVSPAAHTRSEQCSASEQYRIQTGSLVFCCVSATSGTFQRAHTCRRLFETCLLGHLFLPLVKLGAVALIMIPSLNSGFHSNLSQSIVQRYVLRRREQSSLSQDILARAFRTR